MADELHWESAITDVRPNELRLRGFRLDDLMGRATFAEVVWLALRGELPTPAEGRVFEAILVSSIDHGATPPSCLAAITAASTGAPLNASVAAGILSINRVHGGAGEEALELFRAAAARLGGPDGLDGPDAADVARAVVAEARAQKRRLPGFGHRIHTNDPRAVRLLALAEAEGVAGVHVALARALEGALGAQGAKPLPLNVDGAIAAVLGDMGFAPELALGLFLLARVPGLMAHVREERERQKPMRRIHPSDHGYDGPPPRELPAER
jgi:citrate synthase